MNDPYHLLILALATARLTRLVTTDAILSPLRERIWERLPPGTSRLGYLLTCDWCSSIYAATLVVSMYKMIETPTLFVCAILALSMVTGIIADRTG